MSKIKIYLDTNTIIDFFINQARYYRDGGELEIPEKAKFILDNIEKLDIVVSFLIEAEIMRELVAGYGMPVEAVKNTWEDFMKSFRCKYVESFEFDRSLVELALKTKLRLRTLMNFQHLFIAMHEDAYFVTGDKDIINKSKELHIYEKVISYIELREALSNIS